MGFWDKLKNKNKNKTEEVVQKDSKVQKEELVNKEKPVVTAIKEKPVVTDKKTASTTKTTKMNSHKTPGRNIYYVSARKDKNGKKVGWEVKKENATKVTRLVNTKEEALEIVKELAGNQESTIIIRKFDGSIQETVKFKVK
ncbi:MAG: DUF2188 domain-containing protein [Mycoplasmataceae bacterium]|nr:DUF2188 domain-containing protein [Mycoplasmataceae bacterium]